MTLETDKSLPPRKPWLAALLSALQPGLGQLYAGRLGPAFAFALANQLLWPALVLLWAWHPFSLRVLLGIVVPGVALVYVGAILHAVRSARRAAPGPAAPYQNPVAYALFFLLMSLGGQLVSVQVRERAVEGYAIPDAAMAPALLQGDYVLARKVGIPDRRAPGTLAFIKSPKDSMTLLVRRVAAGGGSRVELRGGRVLRDGQPVGSIPGAADFGPTQVPAGHFFVLVDGAAGEDSRHFGPVPADSDLGEVTAIFFSRGDDGIRWGRIGVEPR